MDQIRALSSVLQLISGMAEGLLAPSSKGIRMTRQQPLFGGMKTRKLIPKSRARRISLVRIKEL